MSIQFSVSKTLSFGLVVFSLSFNKAVRLRMWAISSFAVIFFGVAGFGAGVIAVDCGAAAFPFFSGQSRLRCPAFQHRKHRPFFMSSVFSSSVMVLYTLVMTSTSITFSSFSFWKFHHGFPSSLFSPSLLIIRWTLW